MVVLPFPKCKDAFLIAITLDLESLGVRKPSIQFFINSVLNDKISVMLDIWQIELIFFGKFIVVK